MDLRMIADVWGQIHLRYPNVLRHLPSQHPQQTTQPLTAAASASSSQLWTW